MAQEILGNQQQVQTFGDISMGEGNILTITQTIQISVSAIQTRPLNSTSPYKGLKRFEAGDKDLFFGRDQLIASLIKAVGQSNLLLILGASGSGKSSVVRAGLIPQLSELLGSRFCEFTFTPDRDPFESFRISLVSKGYKQQEAVIALKGTSNIINEVIQTLRKDRSQWLIFIDQFEEIFTTCQDIKKRENFIESIVKLTKSQDSSVKIVMAMRADFLDKFSPYPSLGEIAQNNIHLITDMHSDELRLAIEQPAARNGVAFEAGLVEEIIKDVQGQAGSLPLLQYTLDLLWQSDDIMDRTLNLETYHTLGGVRGALQKRVDEIYNNFSKEEQIAAKQIFLRLIDIVGSINKVGLAGRTVSRRAYLSEFTNNLVRSTLHKLIDNNLLVSNSKQKSTSTVEIAHEALINSWQTLSSWINESKEVIIINNRLADDTQRWKKLREENKIQAEDELWSGSKLGRVLELKKENLFELVLGGLSEDGEEFINASVDLRDRRRRTEEERRQRELEQERKARRAAQVRTGVAVVSGGVVGILAIVANTLRLEAEKQTIIATLREDAAVVKNLLATKPLDGLILAIQAADQSQADLQQVLSPVQSSLLSAIEIARERNSLKHEGPILSVAVSPDGQYIVSGSEDGTVRLWDWQNKPIGQSFQGHEGGVYSVAVSPEGQYIVSGSEDGTVRLWDRQGKPIGQPFRGNESAIMSVAVSPDGQYIVSGVMTEQYGCGIGRANRLVNPSGGNGSIVRSVAFSPDGQYIVSGSWDTTVRLWDLKGNQIGKPFRGHESWVNEVAFSPDGQYIVSGGEDGTVRLSDLKGNPIGNPFRAHKAAVSSVAFSPDGEYIVSGSLDDTVRVWNQWGNQVGESFPGHETMVSSVAVSPNGEYIVSGSKDKTVRLWDLKGNQIGEPFRGHEPVVSSVAVGPNGEYIVSGSGNGTIRLWDLKGNQIGEPFRGHESVVSSVAFSPDRQYIVSGSQDGIRLWDLKGNQIGEPFRPQETYININSVAFSPDGRYIVSGDQNSTVQLWDLKGKPIGQPFRGHEGSVTSVAFSPNGQYIASSGTNTASGSSDTTMQLWDLKGNQIGKPFRGHEGSVTSVAFSPNSGYIVSSGGDRTIRLWDLKGNQIGEPFRGHEGSVTSVAFSPNGQYIASSGENTAPGSSDTTVRLWDLKGNQIGEPFRGHEGSVTSVAFSPNGQYIASGSEDETVRLWTGSWETGLQVACNRLRSHPVLVEPKTDVAKGARKACQKYVWKKEESRGSSR